jgi:probable HAF family extracellular repeat protein
MALRTLTHGERRRGFGQKEEEMSQRSGALWTTTTILFLALAYAPAAAQVTFQEIPAPNVWILSMSADGRVGVGISAVNQAGKTVDGFRWTPEGGVENIGGFQYYGIMVSRDGKTIVGHIADANGNSVAAIWQGGKNWKPLGGLPGQGPDNEAHTLSTAIGVSADGSVIVGNANMGSSTTHAFRWDTQNGMVDLGAFWGRSSSARAISADGNTIVGYDYNPQATFPVEFKQGVIYWQGLERLLHPFGWAGTAYATNFNGAITVGMYHPTNAYAPNAAGRRGTTYRYTAWDGRFEDLGAVATGDPLIDSQQYTSTPSAVSDDGEVVGGSTGVLDAQGASVWMRATGMVRVRDWLISQGIAAAQDWRFLGTTYVSPDGKFIEGIGFKPQVGSADVGGSWIVTLR